MSQTLTLPTEAEVASARNKLREDGDFETLPQVLQRSYDYWISIASRSVRRELKRTQTVWRKDGVKNSPRARDKTHNNIKRANRLAGIQACRVARSLADHYSILAPANPEHAKKYMDWSITTRRLRIKFKPNDL